MTNFRSIPLALFLGAVLGHAQPTSQRDIVLEAMKSRPGAVWPRGDGHVVLAYPGSPEEFKAYHEPGGSFSPTFASFGVSLWVGDAEGKLIATSDTIPLADLRQKFIYGGGKSIPALKTETPYYVATWTSTDPGAWLLEVEPKLTEEQRLLLVVRSVGPSGGEIKTIGWQSKRQFPRMAINDRWTIDLPTKVPFEVVAPEAQARVANTEFKDIQWNSDEDWGFARFTLSSTKISRITVRDVEKGAEAGLRYRSVKPGIDLAIPHGRFVESLNAQVAHLMMGLVRNETRPGEPNNYPLNWLRDGAYVVVALARAGRLDVAEQLAVPFAEQDFFGGFGAEADAPGLALWAIEEVAGLTGSRKLDAFFWPHVQRKVGLIFEMLDATNTIRKTFVGPVVPEHRKRNDIDLVCEPAKDGLIQGKMDWHRPVLYINAVSYRGLVNAAAMAERLGQRAQAREWLERAGTLRDAWNRAFAAGKYANERNFISGVYPTFVVSDPGVFRVGHENHWRGTHDASGMMKGKPLWTYFNVAQGHQWLLLGEPGKTWSDLEWFWDHQSSPGLYTWWEGEKEENNFGRWKEFARGWVQPKNITPHYWTAAEMLLLQLGALACVDETKQPVLIVGAGVQQEWLERRISVKGLGTRFGEVDWSWNDGAVNVTQRGFKMPVRLGPSFPQGTRVSVRH